MKLLNGLTLISIALLAASRVGRMHKKRHGARPVAKPADMQTWEGEGGGLPSGGQTPGVKKVAPASLPDTDLMSPHAP